MKYIKLNPKTSYILNPFLFFLGVFLFCFFPRAVTVSFYGLWIPTVCALYCVIAPLGKKRLAHNHDDVALRLPPPQWFFGIVFLEVLLLGMYLGIAFICGYAFPINTIPHDHLFYDTTTHLLTHFGLFPWTIYALVGVGMGVLAYRQQTNAYFSQLTQPFSKKTDTIYGMLVNVGMRRAVLFSLSICLIFMALLIANTVIPLSTHIMHGFQSTALLGTTFLVMFLFLDWPHQKISALFARSIPTFLSIPLFAAIMALILLIISLLAVGFKQQTPETPHLITQWINYDWQTAWLFFSILWWIGLTPLIGAFIAKLSRGYTVRSVIIAVLALPVVLAAISHYPIALSLNARWSTILAGLSFLITLPTLINHRQLSNAIMAYYPKNGEIKFRDHHPFFKSITQLIAALLCLFLVVGQNAMSLIVFSVNYFVIIALVVVAVAVSVSV